MNLCRKLSLDDDEEDEDEEEKKEGEADDAIDVADSSHAVARPRKRGCCSLLFCCCSRRSDAESKYAVHDAWHAAQAKKAERLLGTKQLRGNLQTFGGALLRKVILKATRRLEVANRDRNDF